MSDKEFYFEASIKKEWISLFNKNNISDCMPYLEAVQNRVVYAIYDLNAYYYAKDEWLKRQREMTSVLKEQKRITDSFLFESRIKYCGTEMEYSQYLNKIVFTFFSSMHSFFDIYGKFLLKALLPTQADSNVYFYDVLNKLKDNPKYESIVKIASGYIKDDRYKYIYDLNNINKHNQDILVDSTFFINDGSMEAEIQEFKKRDFHSTENMIQKLEDILEFIVDFYDSVTEEVIKYLKV